MESYIKRRIKKEREGGQITWCCGERKCRKGWGDETAVRVEREDRTKRQGHTCAHTHADSTKKKIGGEKAKRSN